MSELLILFIKATGVGLAIAAPVGPVGVLCMRRAVATGRASAISTGLGAAVADAFYAAVSAFGLTIISDLLLQYKDPAAVVGGLFLLFLAGRIAYSSFKGQEMSPALEGSTRSLLSGFVSTFFLTLTNPATILSFAAIFAGIGFLQTIENTVSASLLVVGVFLGSALWWVILANISVLLKKRLGHKFETIVNLLSAFIIALFGLVALGSLLL